jgi:clan AA aspartic protease (TIGR02281 family)
MKISSRLLWVIFAIMLVVSPVSLNAQKYNKYSDSYNFRKGMEALDERDSKKAEDSFRKEIDEHPENGYAYLYLAHIQQHNEEYGKALSSVDNALKYIPKKDKEYKGACHYKRAGIYRALDKYDEAILDYTMAISYNPDDEDSFWERAQIYFEQEKYDLADADYRAMQKLDANSPLSFMGLGRNEVKRGNFQNAVDLYDHVVALYPEYESGYSFRAEAYMGLKRYMEAASDIVKALELDYDNKAFGLMIDIADSAFVQISTKLKAMAVTDANSAYWPYCLGVINEHVKKYNDAITNYLKASKLDEDAMTYSRISSCYEDMGEWASAIEYMDKAISLDPKDTDYVLYKANIYYEAGQIQTAIEVMDQYIELVPDYAGGYYRRGWFKDNIKDIDGAIEDYTTSITLDSDYPYAIMSRGNMYLLKGENELAKKDFEMVVQKDTIPEEGSCTMYALMHLGRNDEAIEWMNKMLESSEEEGVRYEAACLYSLMGDTEKSLYYLEESLKRGNKSYHHMMTDDDIDNIRNLDAFKALMEKYFPQEVEQESSNEALVEYAEKVVEVPFTRHGGVTQVKCSVNGLPLHFIFDTGAADVTISRVEATFMFKNEYLSSSDVIGKARYMDANGDISVGTVLNIKKITFGGLELENVRASVVESNNAPLLLGQSVLNRLGKIEIDYDRSVLKITTKERIQ